MGPVPDPRVEDPNPFPTRHGKSIFRPVQKVPALNIDETPPQNTTGQK